MGSQTDPLKAHTNESNSFHLSPKTRHVAAGTSNTPYGRDVQIASLFVDPWLPHLPIWGIFSWENAMGSTNIQT
jgi:hypothetical protein